MPADTNHCTENSVLWLGSVFICMEGQHEEEEEKANAQVRTKRFWRYKTGK